MPLKPYSELSKIDVLPYCDMREAKDDHNRSVKVPYLNWAKCIELLRANGAETVWFEPVVGQNGSSLIMSDQVFTDSRGVTNRCYEVRVRIEIDKDIFEYQAPLLNGSNPVKDNSLTQQRLWNAQTRAFVKGVALRTGLGFNLWSGGDPETMDQEDDLSKHSLKAIKQRLQEEYTAVLRKGMSAAEIANALDMDVDEVKIIFTYTDQLERFEKKLVALR
mgnify:CR=1 FL=1